MTTQQVECAECGDQFSKRIAEIARTKNNFCSRGCSVRFHNRNKPKRKKEGKCKTCEKPIKSTLSYCSHECNPNMVDWSGVSLKEMRERRKYQANSAIRTLARRAFHKSNPNATCANPHCDYIRHIEVSHIKPISEWDEDTAIATINNLDNLIGLCPNCHWELDYGPLCLIDGVFSYEE